MNLNNEAKAREILARSPWCSQQDAMKAWDEAVALLNAPPAPWNGEGLPPAGTVCEFAGGEICPDDPWDPDLRIGDQITIVAHFDGGNGDQLAAFSFPTKNPNRGRFNVEQGRWGCFRLIRTPEQIAADEREAAIRQLLKDCYQDESAFALVQAGRLYDAGWRKSTTP